MSSLADAAEHPPAAKRMPVSKNNGGNDAELLSKKKQKKANKVTQKIKGLNGSVDVMVQHTNDDSVVSKRSAVAQDYIRDRFLRYFVKKPSRRSPLINRGYYLRMAVMTDLVTRLLEVALAAPERAAASPSVASAVPGLSHTPVSRPLPPVQVLSLGAGYDTLAMRLLLDSVDVLPHVDETHKAAGPRTTTTAAFPRGDVLFVDVDFPAVLQSKAALMSAAPPHSFPAEWVLTPGDPNRPVTSPHYTAVGVDLRVASAELLSRLRRYGPSNFTTTNFTIIYAECVMQYMPSEDAAKLVELLASAFPNAVFLAYDQVSRTDSFGRVMQKSLQQKNSPLLGIQACPDGAHMTRRALASGMQRAWWANFYRVSRYVLSGTEKQRVEALEAFDELEEWSEMCEHYGITMATTRDLWNSVLTHGCLVHETFVEYDGDGVPLIANTTPTTTTAAGRAALPLTGAAERRAVSAPTSSSLCVAGSLHNWPSARYGFEGWGNGGVAVEPLRNGDRLLVSFGGFSAGKQHQRVSSVFVHSLQEGELRVLTAGEDSTTTTATTALPSSAVAASTSPVTRLPQALVFHTFSRIGAGLYLVWGGRTNPAAATSDAYLLALDIPRTVSHGGTVCARWTPLSVANADAACCPAPRYRHTMVCLSSLEDSGSAREATLLLMGGKVTTSGTLSEAATLDCYRVTVSPQDASISYEPLVGLTGSEAGVVPSAMHSAAAVALSADKVLLSGGVLANRDACDNSLWLLNLSSQQWTRLPIDLGAGRFSHSLTRLTVNHHDYFLMLGGSTWEEKCRAAMGLLIPAEIVNAEQSAQPILPLPLTLPSDVPWWSRHSCVALGEGVVGVLAGGYTCFSFGTFASKPQLLFLGDEVDESAWRGSGAAPAAAAASTGAADAAADAAAATRAGGPPDTSAGAQPVYSYDQLLSKPWPAVREVVDYSSDAFLAAARAAAAPVVFRNVPLGACVRKWASPAYLKNVEGNATVSVHVAEKSQLLDFVRKNFAFRHVSLAELVQHVEDATRLYRATKETPSETWYYRSIAAHMKSERSNLWTDFATLGRDFVLPPGAKEFIEPRLHQSCLRMNAPPLQLWTHYDTLDNVLCQIVGSKRVVLFPPSEYNNLYMSGSSSAVINLDAPDLVRYPRFIQACKAAQEVVLHPGDMLFFPAMWFHHITTLEEGEAKGASSSATAPPYNISVNVFYRHFEDASAYDTKDLYGNKDILAVTRLRTDLHAATRTLLSQANLHGGDPGEAAPPIPSEYAEFALRQFLQDAEVDAANMSNSRQASSTGVWRGA